MQPTLDPHTIESLKTRLATANSAFLRGHPGPSDARQPVHTVYGGAQLFRHDTPLRLAETAMRTFGEYAPDPKTFVKLFGLKASLAARVHERVREKLLREAVEDFRIDFEDGYGNRPSDEEDGHAISCAEEVALGMERKTLSPFLGIRIKTFSDELFPRSLRTLDLFLSTLVSKSKGVLPPNFVITLPKVILVEQVSTFTQLLEALETRLKLPLGTLKTELMVETPQSIFSPEGTAILPKMIRAAQGRCTGVHFGTYDYTASCDITAQYQSMVHPACDFAKHVMQVGTRGMGIFISDGATNVMPVGPHKAAAGKKLTPKQKTENREVVHKAWQLSYSHITHSLKHAYYQGWDLHPAQLPVRYAAVYAFFLEGYEPAADRLRLFLEKAGQATLLGDVFDDAATGQGLLNYFLRALNCGALTEAEAERTGLSLEELRLRSFLKILEGRKKPMISRRE